MTDYLERAGLTESLEKLGFNTVGYGCTTCIGNSGPLPDPVAKAVQEGDLVAAAVLSGNRNFEGRVNPLVKANYLASPPLVVAYALAGTTDIDLTTEPLGQGSDGRDVYLRDIWPTQQQVAQTVAAAVEPAMFRTRYQNVWDSNPEVERDPTSEGDLFDWHSDSTYIQEPPFLIDLAAEAGADPADPRCSRAGGPGRFDDDRPHFARRLDLGQGSGRAILAGAWRRAGRFQQLRLAARQRPRDDPRHVRQYPHPQSVGARHRRGRHAAFARRRGAEHLRRGDEVQAEKVPLVILAGEEYGTGSSRDWAAKGTMLLGVRAVLAASFERIHRSNLVGMGVLPLGAAGSRGQQLA